MYSRSRLSISNMGTWWGSSHFQLGLFDTPASSLHKGIHSARFLHPTLWRLFNVGCPQNRCMFGVHSGGATGLHTTRCCLAYVTVTVKVERYIVAVLHCTHPHRLYALRPVPLPNTPCRDPNKHQHQRQRSPASEAPTPAPASAPGPRPAPRPNIFTVDDSCGLCGRQPSGGRGSVFAGRPATLFHRWTGRRRDRSYTRM